MSRRAAAGGGTPTRLGAQTTLATFGGAQGSLYSPNASYHAQLPPITAATDITITRVTLPLQGTNDTGTVRAIITASDGTLPTTVLAESTAVAIADLPRGSTPAATAFSFAPLPVANGTQYHVGIHTTNPPAAPKWAEETTSSGSHDAYSNAIPAWGFTTTTHTPIGTVLGSAP